MNLQEITKFKICLIKISKVSRKKLSKEKENKIFKEILTENIQV